MFELTRRGFIKLGASAAGLSVIGTKVFSAQTSKDWVTDNGDFYTVIIPEGKTLAKEHFDKPVLLIMGNWSCARDLQFDGFVNVSAKGKEPVLFRENSIDLAKFTPAVRDMAALNLLDETIAVHGVNIETHGRVDCGFKVNSTSLVQYPDNCFIWTNPSSVSSQTYFNRL